MEEDPADREGWPIVCLKFMGFYWRGVFLFVWPCICALVFLINFKEDIRCLFVVCLMGGYWVTESIPLYVTGLIPVVLLPLLGVLNTNDVSRAYFNNTNMVFLASICIGLALEYSGLHKRIAYNALLLIGCSLRRLHFGLILVTSLLSMWLINSATTAMMIPIVGAVLEELEHAGVGNVYYPLEPDEDLARPTKITIAYYLATAYGATIGGIGTLVGTGTNLLYKGLYETRFPEGNKIDFVPWMLFNLPPMLAMTIFAWFSLEIVYMGLLRPNSAESLIIKQGNELASRTRDIIQEKANDLGKMQWNEIGVLILFLGCICAWIFRKPEIIPGWGNLYTIQVQDATPAVAVIVLFSLIPLTLTCFQFCTTYKSKRPKKPTQPLVPWKTFQSKFPWGLIFLLGGGMAVAEGGKQSGMSKFLGDKLGAMSDLPTTLVLMITTLFAQWATELSSNVAICSIVSPVLLEMSVAMNIHPIQFTLPAAIMCSFAFLVPVGTPPNAMIVDAANIRTIDMVKGGILLKLFAWLLYCGLVPTYGRLFFDIGEAPDWAKYNDTSFFLV